MSEPVQHFSVKKIKNKDREVEYHDPRDARVARKAEESETGELLVWRPHLDLGRES